MSTMRVIHGLVILVVTLATPVAAQDTPQEKPGGRISGRVVDAASGRPVRWAVVRLVSQQGRQMPAGTDAQGRFEYTGLAAGRYTLDVRAERYLPTQFGGTPYDGFSATTRRPIVLGEHEHFDRADVALPRPGAVEGRVIDEFGDSAPNIVVQVSRMEYAAGRRRLMPIGGLQQRPITDDRGQFRIYGLQPGVYFLSALSGVFTDQNEVGGFAPTYYPGTPDPAAAQRVRVSYGTDVSGLVIPLVPAKSARVSGRVVDERGQPAAGANLMLTYSDRLGISDVVMARAVAGPDGAFALRNVPPGQYTLQGFGRPPAGGPQNLNAGAFGWLMVPVDGAELTDLVLQVTPGAKLRGRIVVKDPSGPKPGPRDVSIGTMPVEFDSAPFAGGPPPLVIRDDLTFELSNMSGRRLVGAMVRSPAFMVDRLLLDGRDVTDMPVDFRKGDVDDLEIVLTTRVSSVGGRVIGPDDEPAADYTVILFARDEQKWTVRSRFVHSARPAQDGRFTVHGVPPGDYLAVALPYVQGSEWTDPEFLASLSGRATGVTVAEGEAVTLDLRLSSR